MRNFLLLLGLMNIVQAMSQTSLPDSLYHLNSINGSKQVTVGKIIIKGNKITKDKIILRELEFSEGEVLSKESFEERLVLSRQNLMNRSLFNFVTFTTIPDGQKTDVLIDVVERWYIWPVPIVEYADRNINAWWETKNFSRLNYGLDLRVENFRGRMEYLNFIVKGGYDRTLALVWDIPYLNKKQTVGLSVSGGTVYNHELPVQTVNNKLQYLKITDGYAGKRFFAEATLLYRPGYRFLHAFGLTYTGRIFHDSLMVVNPDFSYGGNKYNYLSFQYVFKLDNRDYKPYPLNGYYFDIKFWKNGLGLLSKKVNLLTVQSAFDQYINLYKRWYFAYNVSVRFTIPDDAPYFLSSGLGLNDMEIRGYDLFVVNGQNIGLWRSNFKYEILPQKTFNISWIKTEKFSKVFLAVYANLFFDAAYVSDVRNAETNPLANQLIWGTGLGIDFVTYYDVVLRVEYAINKEGTKGLYLSLVAPI